VFRYASKGRKGLRYKSVSKKPFLTQRQKDERIAFAVKNKKRLWKHVLFTDSKYFVYQFSTGTRAKKVWCSLQDRPVSEVTK